MRSLPVTADTITRNSPLKSQKGVPVHTPKLWSLVESSPVYAVKVLYQPAQQESEGLRTGRSLLEISPHLSEISSIKVVMSAVEGFSGVMTRMNA